MSSPNALPMALFLNSIDRKSTRLNSSHLVISYAVFCLKKKKIHTLATKYLTVLGNLIIMSLELTAPGAIADLILLPGRGTVPYTTVAGSPVPYGDPVPI